VQPSSNHVGKYNVRAT